MTKLININISLFIPISSDKFQTKLLLSHSTNRPLQVRPSKTGPPRARPPPPRSPRWRPRATSPPCGC